MNNNQAVGIKPASILQRAVNEGNRNDAQQQQPAFSMEIKRIEGYLVTSATMPPLVTGLNASDEHGGNTNNHMPTQAETHQRLHGYLTRHTGFLPELQNF